MATTTHYEHTPRQMTGVRRTQRGGVSSAKAPLRRGADDWLFMMRDGSRVVTLIDQFDKVLDLAGITHNSHDDNTRSTACATSGTISAYDPRPNRARAQSRRNEKPGGGAVGTPPPGKVAVNLESCRHRFNLGVVVQHLLAHLASHRTAKQ